MRFLFTTIEMCCYGLAAPRQGDVKVLRRIVAVFASAFIFQASASAAAPAEDFVYLTATNVTVSPTGRYVAVITAHGENESTLAVAPFADGKAGRFVGVPLGKHYVESVYFKTDDRLIVSLIQRDVPIVGLRDDDKETVKINRRMVVAVDRDGSDSQVMMPDNELGAEVQSLLWDDPQHILLQTQNKGSYATDLYFADITTGEVRTAESGRARLEGTSRKQKAVLTYGWETAADGFAYVRYDANLEDSSVTVYTRPRGGDWARFKSYPVVYGAPTIEFAGMASDGTAYVLDRANGDRRAAWEYDLATGQPLRMVISDPHGEVVGMRANRFKGGLIGAVVVTSGMPKTIYTSKPFAAAQAVLDENFADYPVRSIVSYSRDLGVYALSLEGPDQPPVFVFFDARAMAVTPAIAATPLTGEEMGKTTTITWASSDGRIITGYLTMPPGVSKPPLVVMPHGGPEAQDDLTFDAWRQFIATRGYAVLQPQYRGGDGFGLAHEQAGHGTWGTLVQDDVRTGVEKLVSEGIVDPDRRCIFGWSYGGYMAMTAAALSPDLYKCSIAGAGLSDVDGMLAWEGERAGTKSQVFAYWLARMGDQKTREAASAVDHVGNVKIPLLLIHGDKDSIVPIEQSERMEEAMKKAGKPVEFIRLHGEDHSPYGPARVQTLRALEDFLAKHING